MVPLLWETTQAQLCVCVCVSHDSVRNIQLFSGSNPVFFVRKIPLSSVESILIFKGGLFSVACKNSIQQPFRGVKTQTIEFPKQNV